MWALDVIFALDGVIVAVDAVAGVVVVVVAVVAAGVCRPVDVLG